MRELCACGKPYMILSSETKTDELTTKVMQVTRIGCLNSKCDKKDKVIRIDEKLIG